VEQLDYVWIGEGRWKTTGDWYTLFSTCQPSRTAARGAVIAHPNYNNFDKIRTRKFLREDGLTRQERG
jgi:hypothetical protein